MAKHKAKLEKAQVRMEEACKQIADDDVESKKDLQEYERILSWAGVFDQASNETKHMIISNLIDRVEVENNYQITICFKLTLAQYNGKAA